MNLRPNEINHIAITVSDMKRTLQFFNELLGLPLVALYWMHNTKDTIHGFLQLNEDSLLGFVASPEIKSNIKVGETHPGHPSGATSKGTMHHLAFNVESENDLSELKAKALEKGVDCFGPCDNLLQRSLYFAAPDGITIEVCTNKNIKDKKRVENNAVEKLGLSEQELFQLQNPEPYVSPAKPVQNVAADASAHKMAFPESQYNTMIRVPDDLITRALSDSLPPAQTNKVFWFKQKLAQIELFFTVLKIKLFK